MSYYIVTLTLMPRQSPAQQETPKKSLLGSIFKKSTKKDAVEAFRADNNDDDDDLVRTRKTGAGAGTSPTPTPPITVDAPQSRRRRFVPA